MKELKATQWFEFLILSLPILVLIGLSIQFMVLDVDSISTVEVQQSFLSYMSDWWYVNGFNRLLGQGTFLAIYQLPGILAVYQLGPVLAILSRYLFIVTALIIMRRDGSDRVWLLGLALVAPFWLDPALLFARAVNELMSALVFYWLFRKVDGRIGWARVLAFCALQALVYEAFLIPGLAVIWFARSEDRGPIYGGVTLFAVLYVGLTKIGLLASSKLATSVQQEGVMVKADGVSTFMPYAGKYTQLINTIHAATPVIVVAALLVGCLLAYFLYRRLETAPTDMSLVRRDIVQWVEFLLGCGAPVLVNWVISQMAGNQGRVYWMMVSNSWMLLILFAYQWGLHLKRRYLFIGIVTAMFFLSSVLILELRVDLSSHDLVGFSGKFFRGFTSHFGYY